jgi:hypothetical protein
MKKKFILVSTVVVAVIGMSFELLNDNGKAGATGSPNETACNSCHTGNALNAPGGSLTITSPTLTNGKYTPGQTYTINVTVAKTNATLFGLGFEALTSANANAGTLTAGTGTKLLNATISGNSRANIVHAGTGNTGTGTHTFTFTWKAPATDIGNITFYCAGNAANNNGVQSGDFIYTTSQVLSADVNGVKEELFASKIRIFPNPAADYLQIDNANSLEEMTVSIMDLKGSVISQKQHVAVNDKIELNELNAGSYLLRIETGGKVAVKQFIKQ